MSEARKYLFRAANVIIIIIFMYSSISNVHRDTRSVDYITITYNYNN